MRWIATFFTLIACAATGLAAKELHAALSQPMQKSEPGNVSRSSIEARDVVIETPVIWPALFGEPVVQQAIFHEPQVVETDVQTALPTPPKPSLSSLGYELKGLIQTGDEVWGLVSFPGGDQILKEGDRLGADMTVEGIDDTGLWIDTGADTPELLAFPD